MYIIAYHVLCESHFTLDTWSMCCVNHTSHSALFWDMHKYNMAKQCGNRKQEYNRNETGTKQERNRNETGTRKQEKVKRKKRTQISSASAATQGKTQSRRPTFCKLRFKPDKRAAGVFLWSPPPPSCGSSNPKPNHSPGISGNFSSTSSNCVRLVSSTHTR